ncbi:MAG: molybdopterin oxidoreductase family protein [Sphingomonadales bacterium]|nr:molybdopterin oxidoreductase family protein [Sphingomonadales bacterium]
MPVTHHRTCAICEANCGIIVTAEGRDILSIKPDPANALSRGHICPKATALEDLQNDPDRLRRPIKRTGDAWEEISWDQAFAEIGEKTRALMAAHPGCTALYIGNPNAHSYANALTSGDLKSALKTRNFFSASTVDQMPHQVSNLRLYGHSGLWGVPDIDRTQTMIIMGGNPMASNGSVWTVPDFRTRAKALQARGGELIVVDPRRSETAKIADRHIFIRPGGDAFMLVALLKTVFSMRSGVVPDWLHGTDGLREALDSFDAASCAARAGVSMAEIDHLATRLTSGPAALYGRMGTSTQSFGTLCAWLIACINAVSGQLDREGGIMFPAPAVDTVEVLGKGSIGKRHSRVSGHPDVLGEFPAACMAEEIETPGEGQIRALFVVAGNPVLSTPNGTRLAAAFSTLDLMVSIDMYRNATSRLAHYILPPTGPLEREHYGLFLLPIAIRNFGKFSEPLFEKAEGTLHDWEILRGLGAAISGEETPKPDPRVMLDGLLKAGPYGVSLEELASHQSGMDFGEMQAGRFPARLKTPDKTVNLAVPDFIADLERLRAAFTDDDSRLKLIGRRHVRSNNSWLHNSARLVKGKDRCTLMIHPDDARARNLGDGSTAEVSSRTGSIRLKVEVTDDMMPGTISIPHGWGHNLPGVAMGVAQAHGGVSVNDLTDEALLDPLSGNAALSGVPVDVRAVG